MIAVLKQTGARGAAYHLTPIQVGFQVVLRIVGLLAAHAASVFGHHIEEPLVGCRTAAQEGFHEHHPVGFAFSQKETGLEVHLQREALLQNSRTLAEAYRVWEVDSM
jgi:hypothetical protein